MTIRRKINPIGLAASLRVPRRPAACHRKFAHQVAVAAVAALAQFIQRQRLDLNGEVERDGSRFELPDVSARALRRRNFIRAIL